MTRRLSRGTTLVEVLVVIVILSVGILAVIQIFPRGFGILSQTRATSQANALARAEADRYTMEAAGIPESILPVSYQSATSLTTDSRISPTEYAGYIEGVTANGEAIINGTNVGPLSRTSGLNWFRRIVGESYIVPAPRRVSDTLMGSLLTLRMGPIETTAYQPLADPEGLLVRSNTLGNAGPAPADLAPVGGGLFTTASALQPFEFFAEGWDSAPNKAIYVVAPASPTRLLIRYAGQGATFTLPAATAPGQVARVDLSSLPNFASVGSGPLLADRFSVAYLFTPLNLNDPFPVNDPYRYKFLNAAAGSLVISPYASSEMSDDTGDGRDPLRVYVDYTVADWRNLVYESRGPTEATPTLRLPLGRLKVGNEAGADGRPNSSVPLDAAGAYQSPLADNLVIVDTTTGGVVCETENADGTGAQYVSVDKSSGLIRFTSGVGGAFKGRVSVAGGAPFDVDLTGRPLRVVYRVKDEWAVAPMKASSSYYQVTGTPGIGEFGIQGNLVTFPLCDANKRVTLGTVDYVDAGGVSRQITGLDAVIGRNGFNPTGQPFIDLTPYLNGGTLVGVRGIRGSSLTVRVMRNTSRYSVNGTNASNLSNFLKFTQDAKITQAEVGLTAQESNP